MNSAFNNDNSQQQEGSPTNNSSVQSGGMQSRASQKQHHPVNGSSFASFKKMISSKKLWLAAVLVFIAASIAALFLAKDNLNLILQKNRIEVREPEWPSTCQVYKGENDEGGGCDLQIDEIPTCGVKQYGWYWREIITVDDSGDIDHTGELVFEVPEPSYSYSGIFIRMHDHERSMAYTVEGSADGSSWNEFESGEIHTSGSDCKYECSKNIDPNHPPGDQGCPDPMPQPGPLNQWFHEPYDQWQDRSAWPCAVSFDEHYVPFPAGNNYRYVKLKVDNVPGKDHNQHIHVYDILWQLCESPVVITDTPVTPTDTPVTPTDTPSTPTPTATATPTPTNTPTPTVTPAPLPTNAPTPGIQVNIKDTEDNPVSLNIHEIYCDGTNAADCTPLNSVYGSYHEFPKPYDTTLTTQDFNIPELEPPANYQDISDSNCEWYDPWEDDDNHVNGYNQIVINGNPAAGYIYDITLDVPTDFYYDDNVILTVNDVVIFATSYRLWDDFDDSGDLKIFDDINMIKGVEAHGSDDYGMCIGGRIEGYPGCEIPGSEAAGTLSVTIPEDLQDDLTNHIGSDPIVVTLTSTGDDDPPDDCVHSAIGVTVHIQPNEYAAAGTRISAQTGDNSLYHILGVTPNPEAEFERRPGDLADEDEANPDSDYYVWGNSQNWHTGMRYVDFVVVTPGIHGNFYENDGDLTVFGPSYCTTSETPASVSLNNASVVAESGTDNVVYPVNNSQTSYSMEVYEFCDGCYTLSLNLPVPADDAASAYTCECTAAGDDPFTCIYLNIPSNVDQEFNFFLQSLILSNETWWQVIGGNVFSEGNVNSDIPSDSHCTDSDGCYNALSLNNLNYSTALEENSAGFPFASSGSPVLGDGSIHFPGHRLNSNNGQVNSGFTLNQRGYSYYYTKLEDEIDTTPTELTNGQEPPLSGAGISDLPVFQTGDLTINSSWEIEAGEELVVLVDGDLNINGTPDTPIIEVEPGGFLAFIVSGDINIDGQVGYVPLDPVQDIVFGDPFGGAAPNIEGVYVADQEITIEAFAAGNDPDHKFIGAGTFVGWLGVNLPRDFHVSGTIYRAYNNKNPTSVFIYRPDLVDNFPDEMKEAQYEYREVEPQRPTPSPTP